MQTGAPHFRHMYLVWLDGRQVSRSCLVGNIWVISACIADVSPGNALRIVNRNLRGNLELESRAFAPRLWSYPLLQPFQITGVSNFLRFVPFLENIYIHHCCIQYTMKHGWKPSFGHATAYLERTHVIKSVNTTFRTQDKLVFFLGLA